MALVLRIIPGALSTSLWPTAAAPLASAGITYRSGSYTVGGASSCNAALPAGVKNGDLLIATIATDSATPQGTSGFTQRASGDQGHGPVYVSTKIANNEGATEPFGGGAGSYCTVLMDVYQFVDNGQPMDVAATVGTGAASNVTFPNVTTVTDKVWHYATYVDAGATDSTAPTSYTQRQNQHPTEFHSYDRAISPAGLVSGVATTGGGTGWVAFSLALRPAWKG